MKIKFSKQFKNDLKKIKKSKHYHAFLNLYSVTISNPFRTPPPYEKLGGINEHKYSRRINKQHRLVYVLREDHILFDRCWGHYDD